MGLGKNIGIKIDQIWNLTGIKYCNDIGELFCKASGFSMGLMVSIPMIIIELADDTLQCLNITNFDITETIYNHFLAGVNQDNEEL